MRHIRNLRDGKVVFDALSSEVRIKMLELLMEHKELNLDYFAKALDISNSAITMHVKKLSAANLIETKTASGIRGSMKVISLINDRILIDFQKESLPVNIRSFELGIGHYTNYHVEPTCGIVTTDNIIGEFDEPRYFSFTERYKAALIWLTSGFLEYKIPNALKPDEAIQELQISMEISSEAPGFSSHYPSDISFNINGVDLGFWTTAGEYNDKPGNFTPSWWFPNLGQYGKKKMLIINENGTFIDGISISNTTIDKLKIGFDTNISFTVSAPKDAQNAGGLTIFGHGFGDYNNGIEIKMHYLNKSNNNKR